MSVCLVTNVNPSKAAEPIEIPFGRADSRWVQSAAAKLSGNSLRQKFTPIVLLFTK